jgi:hypothetical protein
MRRNELALLPKLPLLITESAEELDALRDAFEREIKPRGIIEQMYVSPASMIGKCKMRRKGWFTDKEAHKQVLETLSRFELDETAIEAEAKSSADLELLDRMVSSLESRRDKALGCVAEYRASLAHQLRQSADRIIDGKGVLPLEHASSKRPTAA